MSDTRNELLKRREVTFVLESAKNPGFSAVLEELSSKFKVASDLIAVKSIHNNYGTNTFNIRAFLYDSVESKQEIEPKVKVKKTGGSS